VPSLPISSDRRYCALVLNTVLGGGMSSRLFQTVREERGLAYSIYSDLSPFKDTGMLCVYAGTSSGKALQMIQLVTQEFRRLKEEPMPADELRRAKDQLLGNIILSMESSGARMSNLARQEMYFDHFFGMDEVMQQVEAVTEEQVMTMARELFDPEKIAVTMLGRLDAIKVGRSDLVC
jgi:predicted Zn-dependent peptidase